MAVGDKVEGAELIARFASGGHVDGDAINGSAFMLRKDEPGLSVNRLSFFGASVTDSLAHVRKVCCLTLRPSARFAELLAADVEEAFAEVAELQNLVVIEDPYAADERCPANPAHALVNGLPPFCDELAEMAGDLLAQKVRTAHPALAS